MKERYYRLLKERFPNKAAVLTEIINLEAILHLPKGTEYFVSDLHGEYGAFDYLLRNSSGSLRRKLETCYLPIEVDKDELAIFIYYPEEKISQLSAQLSTDVLESWLIELVPTLMSVLQSVGSKYSRSKVRKAFPKEFGYIIEELLTSLSYQENKEEYVAVILNKLSALGCLKRLVVVMAEVIQNLMMDHLHVVGDIFDRGWYPDCIIDRLMGLRSVDIQWGNHDITWMGAASGSMLCMVNVIRIAARYNNIRLLEEGYGISLRQLMDYSKAHYQPLPSFKPNSDEGAILPQEADLLNQLQQATAILQFKLEHQLIARRPEFGLEHRQLLNKIDYQRKEITLNGKRYPLKDFNDTCIDPSNPSSLSAEEEALLQQLMSHFQSSDRLRKHIDFLLEKGSMYLVYNHNLLYHGCIPLHENGDFKSLRIDGKAYSGKSLLDFYERQIRQGAAQPYKQEDFATDLFWYLWVGECSSLFGKDAMKTFERYYIIDKETHKEKKNAYYPLRQSPQICHMILEEFGLDKTGKIINGHTPVIEREGESPIKADGQLLVIDGGFAKAYQKKTGMAGYSLVSNSYGLQLVAHQPFSSVTDVLEGGCEIVSMKRLVDHSVERVLVKETNIGADLLQEVADLEHLYNHFEEF